MNNIDPHVTTNPHFDARTQRRVKRWMKKEKIHSDTEENEVSLYMRQLFHLKKAKKSPPPEIPVKKFEDPVETINTATTASIESEIGKGESV